MMKKILTLALCAAAMATASAQMRGGHRPRVVVRTRPMPSAAPEPDRAYDSWRTTYYGLRLGLNASSVRSEAAALDGHHVATGVNVGFVVGTQLARTTPLCFETGLCYSQKGGKGDNAAGGRFTYDLDYLEVPLLLKYRHFTSAGLAVEPFAGAYMACGVAGDIKDYGERRAFSSYSDGYFGRFDAGLRLGCGLGFGVGYAEVAYDLGLTNVGQDAFDDTHNGCFTVSVGVNF